MVVPPNIEQLREARAWWDDPLEDARAECWCPGGSRRVAWPTDKEEG